MDPSQTATSAGEVRVYNSSGVDNVGSIQTTSYPITPQDWNTAAASGTSLKVTLQAPFTPNGTSGYIIGHSILGGYSVGSSATCRLNNVNISASVSGSSTISWASVTTVGGTLTSPPTFERRVLYGAGVISGTYLTYGGSGLSGTITNVNYPDAVLNIPSVNVYNQSVRATLTGVTISATASGVTNFSWTGSSTSTGTSISSFNSSGFVP
jgi:hypothetical protein